MAPADHEVLAVIWYNRTTSYQFIRVPDLLNARKRIPEGALFFILCHSFGRTRWSTFTLIEEPETIGLHKYHLEATRDYMMMNKDYDFIKKNFSFSEISQRFTSRKNFTKNLVMSNIAAGNKVEIKNKQLHINGIKIKRSFIREFVHEIKSYILYRNMCPYDYAELEKLINDNILTTLFFDRRLDLKDLAVDNKLIVPVTLNKIIYFLYGRDFEIESFAEIKGKKTKWGVINSIKPKAETHLRRFRPTYNGPAHFMKCYKGKPIFFVKGIPIMYHSRVKRGKNDKTGDNISPDK
jgi:hypothetical protein